ncbi:hypothetical protein HHI36_009900 [Cryptolaemus montrouzieri]|uniref:Uncharacterized protein n=1 Tax=Cryptolaemus montrouzieri TaxID=559131 RepID=A0ABD2MH93_9CUCU
MAQITQNLANLETKIVDQMLQNSANLETKLVQNSAYLEIKIFAQITDINATHSRNIEEISLKMEENAKKLIKEKIQGSSEQKYLELSREIAALNISNVEVAEKGRTTESIRQRSWTEKEKATALVGVLGGTALDILEELSKTHLGNYTLIVEQLQSRFGDLHFEHVYGAQVNNCI